MLSEAQKRVKLFLEAAAAPTKKPQPKKVSGKTPGAFHDKLDQKLSVIGKKYGVKITLQRNKTKLPSILISGLKALTFDKVSELFNAIPNTSHVPNKISGNTALFRVFGKNKPTTLTAGSDENMPSAEKKMLLARTKKALKETHEKYKASKDPGEKAYLKRTRKSLYDNVKMFKKIGMTASENDPQYVVTAKKNGKRVYWKEDGFTALTAKDAEPLDEETADKIERRLTAKGEYTDIKTVPFKMTADDDNSNADDTSSDDSDDSEDNSDDSGDDSDDSGDDAQDTANKADMVKFITTNNISKQDLSSLIDKASSAYTDSLKSDDSSMDDVVDFVYSMLGPDDSKTGLKALANKASMNKDGGGV